MGTREPDLLAAVASYLAGLRITQGRFAGEPLDLLDWELRFLDRILAPDVDTAALSVPRGNGKTTYVAAIACATLDGPLAQPRAETILIASSREQARIAFEHAAAFLRPQMESEPSAWRLRDSVHAVDLTYRPTETRLRVLSSDPRRMHGPAPNWILIDEPAQMVPTQAPRIYAALRTALGKIPGAKLLAFGTKSADDDHFFSRMLDGEADVAEYYGAPAGAPLTESTFRRANPSWDKFPDLRRTIRKEAGKAEHNPALRAQFDALRLNSGTLEISRAVLLDRETWQALERYPDDLPERRGEYVLGLDLSSGYAMSAAAACWPETGRVEILAAFPAVPDLVERATRDRQAPDLYERMARDGDLIVCGERVVDLEQFLLAVVERFGAIPARIATDRWRRSEMLDALGKLGLTMIDMVWRGQGWRDGGQDVSDFRAAAASRSIHVPRSLALRNAMANSVTLISPTGDAKIAKNKNAGYGESKGRDDLAVALVLAVAEANRIARRGPARFEYVGGVIV